jgi:gas vesicle protein
MSIKKITEWAFIALAFMVTIVSFIAIVKTFGVLSDGIISGLLGFIGSIIGGVITLVGVRWTILENRRMIMQEKIEKEHYICEKLSDLFLMLKYSVENQNAQHVVECSKKIREFIENEHEILRGTDVSFSRQFDLCLSNLEIIESKLVDSKK